MPGARELLFPDPPRRFPAQRAVKVVARGLHTAAAGVLVGAHVLEAPGEARTTWLLATLVTGAALLAVDLFESAAFLAQVRGLVLLLKLAVVAVLPWLGAAAGPVLLALVVVAVVSSHAPSSVRYRLWIGRDRIRGASSRG